MEYTIEKNVEVPAVNRHRSSRTAAIYNAAMACSPTDSFLVPFGEDGNTPQTVARLRVAVMRQLSEVRKVNPDWKFLTRHVDNGLRVWRKA